MSRCAVCDHLEGHSSPTTPFINRYTSSRVRWRDKPRGEYQCDDCYDSITVTNDSFKPIAAPEEGEIDLAYLMIANDDFDETQIETGEVASAVPLREIE